MFSVKMRRFALYLITFTAIALISTCIWFGFRSSIDVAYEMEIRNISEYSNNFNTSFSKYDDFLFNTGKNNAFNDLAIPVNTNNLSHD